MRFVVAGLFGILAFAAVFLAWPEYKLQPDCGGDTSVLGECAKDAVTEKSTYRMWGGLRWVQSDQASETNLNGQYALQPLDALLAATFAGFVVGGVTGMIGGAIASRRDRRPTQTYVVK